MCTDERSLPSEKYALEFICKKLGCQEVVKNEKELINEQEEGCVPEGIFKDNKGRKIISVEVKRIVGNDLPSEAHEKTTKRKLIRRRKHIVWPWTSTVVAALSKANSKIVERYNVNEHHIVFVIPESMDNRSYERLLRHIDDSVRQYFSYCQDLPLKKNKFFVHSLRGPSMLFDRF
jgi:hypothetical protein